MSIVPRGSAASLANMVNDASGVPPHDHEWIASRVIVSRRVLDGSEPVRLIIHHDDDTWSVLCGTVTRPEDAEAQPMAWLAQRENLAELAATLERGWLWERDREGGVWMKERDLED